ncbi:MAG: hypothetical protein DRN30_06410 [Thermoplasmata archaeon]|nr:MAG: hypothetical protein DRN30_06410 [Thermoplasmata archaeon]
MNIQDYLNAEYAVTQESIVDLVQIGETPFLYNGLNIFYGRESSGKSWQSPVALRDVQVEKVYIDADGSNGSKFKQHCIDNGFSYIPMSKVLDNLPANISIKEAVVAVITDLTVAMSKHNERVVFIVDNPSAISEGMNINNSQDISPLLYEFNGLCETLNTTIILIDHSTDTRGSNGQVNGFKLEGNAGAKRRATVTTVRYDPLNTDAPWEGGTLTNERARGNTTNLKKGDFQVVANNNTAKLALDFLKEKCGKVFSKSDLTNATRNTKDKWIRTFIDDIATTEVEGRSTTYTLIDSNTLTDAALSTQHHPTIEAIPSDDLPTIQPIDKDEAVENINKGDTKPKALNPLEVAITNTSTIDEAIAETPKHVVQNDYYLDPKLQLERLARTLGYDISSAYTTIEKD